MTAETAFATAQHECTTVLQVQRRRTAADGVLLLTFADPCGRELPAWAPGAHIDLALPDLGIRRQYSLCGSPADRSGWQIAVLREPDGRGGSAYVHEALQVGSMVEVRGPRNHFPLVPAERYLFIAGGIGITPVRPMIEAATAGGRSWELYYGGRSRRSMAFLDELSAYGDRVRVYARAEAGRLPLAAVLASARPGCVVYCCGPERLLAEVEARCSGWPAGSVHTERFGARPDLPGRRESAFDLVLRRSGRTLRVPPDRSILDVAEAAGVAPLWACREGTCGTCETRVLEGVPAHRDSVLSAGEKETGESLMICVSRSSSPRLVLDL
jgi:ferredoxin-NADP reductase